MAKISVADTQLPSIADKKNKLALFIVLLHKLGMSAHSSYHYYDEITKLEIETPYRPYEVDLMGNGLLVLTTDGHHRPISRWNRFWFKLLLNTIVRDI